MGILALSNDPSTFEIFATIAMLCIPFLLLGAMMILGIVRWINRRHDSRHVEHSQDDT